ncbi:hypothetical protein [Clostridium frigidicarnis]|uniref:Uncharacterized protein n=1 Tax=Clostridium frigidicarnis TaxID=84698 RepID=A0A1I1A8I3_9CLOT|nr:hypothetical protein [Clostridium frigidicarnis]SFB34309.1 hypothetical protein SAMN04488528_103130 [Clostridium frigidicarnis]
MYSNYNYKNLVGQHCYGYTPKSIIHIMSNGPSGESCYNCTHYISGNGNCSQNLYEAMSSVFKNN